MSKVELTAKQREFWREATHRWNIKVGATRSGKTYMDYFLIPKRLIERRGEDGLAVILGNTRETIRRNIIIPMQNIYGAKRVSNIRSGDNSCIMFGQKVFCLGADNVNHVDRIRGASIKYCYGDEVATWHPEVLEMLKSRLDKPKSCFDGALNPQSPNHWMKDFLDSDADIYQQQYTIFDNPFLPKSFVEDLCKEYAGTVYYQRYILGEWALAEGLIYPMYQGALAEQPVGNADKYVMSIDYGTQNAFAALLWELHDGVWYATREYYYSGRDEGAQKTDEEYGVDLDRFVEDIGGEIKVAIDPSAASFIALLRKKPKFRVIKADNAVADGIRETATAMQTGKIKICNGLTNWRREAEGYVWDESAQEDRPVKVNDHCLTGDTMVLTKNGEKRIDSLVGTSGEVWSYNTETGKAEVKPFHDCKKTQETAEIYEIEVEDGRIVRCTGEHPILTQRGYVLAKYLTLSDKILTI